MQHYFNTVKNVLLPSLLLSMSCSLFISGMKNLNLILNYCSLSAVFEKKECPCELHLDSMQYLSIILFRTFMGKRAASPFCLFVYCLRRLRANLLWDVWSSLVNLKVISSLMLLYSSYLIFFMERTEWPYSLLFLINLLMVQNFNEVKNEFCLTEKQKDGNVSEVGRTFSS